MEGSLLLPLSDGLIIEHICRQEQQIIISVSSTAALARCPLCAAASESIHSHYLRTVADLPEVGQLVILKLRVRRFFCRNALCTRRIFTERLPELVRSWAQMTNRLRETLCVLNFATCAEVGSRLAPHLGMKGSPSTLLRCQKAASLAPPAPFTKIGLDDFAFRRGRTYGTIIVNLEAHRLIDVLPDRTVETVAAWLAAHPDIEVISRDRASDYATAATLGAPQARQVCDRWHLLRNLSEHVTIFLARMRAQIRKTSQEQAPPREEDTLEEARWKEREACEQARATRRQERRARKTVREQTKAARQEERLDRYQQMLTLKSQGLSPEEIAPRVGCSARTVRQWLADGVKTTPRRRRPSPLDAYASHLRRRWEEGEQRAEKLYQELLEKGYTGSVRAVYRYLNRWRSSRTDRGEPVVRKHRPRKTAPPPGPFDIPFLSFIYQISAYVILLKPTTESHWASEPKFPRRRETSACPECKSEDSVKQNRYNYVGEWTSTIASEKGPQGKHEKRTQEREVPISLYRFCFTESSDLQYCLPRFCPLRNTPNFGKIAGRRPLALSFFA